MTTYRNQETFEVIVEALRPFISEYAIASGNRVKIWLDTVVDTAQLDSVLLASGNVIQRGQGRVLFVDYSPLTAEEASAIMAGSPVADEYVAFDAPINNLYDFEDDSPVPDEGE